MLRVISLMAVVTLLPGCDSVIYDDEGDCDPVHVVKFNYDMNMKFADAFHAEVASVDLYVFDRDGNFVTSVSRNVNPAEARNFSIELHGLAPGHYDLLAWCGVKDSKHFRVNPQGVALPGLEHHICRIDREDDSNGDGHVREDVGRLFHGMLSDVDMTQDEGRYEHTIRLTKDTNVIRVVLQHMSGAPMSKDDYDICITDANGLYDHANNLLRDAEITYHPWSLRSGTAAFHPEDAPAQREQTTANAVVAELTVGRLMASRHKDAVLRVRNACTGENIVTLPLIETLLMVKGYYYSEDGVTPMSDQEYLDRQDDYPLTFFLDERDEWIRTVIYINSWRVILNQSSVH